MQGIVKLLVHCFDADGTMLPATAQLPRVVLVMHRWWTSAANLAALLGEAYKDLENDDACDTNRERQAKEREREAKEKEREAKEKEVKEEEATEEEGRQEGTKEEEGKQEEGEDKESKDKEDKDKEGKDKEGNDDDDAVCKHGAADLGRCIVARQRLQVCHVFRYWIANFPLHFEVEPGLVLVLQDFSTHLPEEWRCLVDTSALPTFDWMRNPSVRPVHHQPRDRDKEKEHQHLQQLQLYHHHHPHHHLHLLHHHHQLLQQQQALPPGAPHNEKVSLVFTHMEAEPLAQHITFLEHKVIRRITFHDLKGYASSGRLQDTPRLERSVSLFNGLTQWVQCMVLSRTTPQERAEVIEKFIDVAQYLHRLHNYNSLMAVVGSLSHSALARLAKTKACLQPDYDQALETLSELLSSNSNFSNYRRALHDCQGFKIPILGIHLKDMIAIHAAVPDWLSSDHVNVRKMAQLTPIVADMEDLAHVAAPVVAHVDVVNTLRLSLDVQYTEDDIFELSLAREPRSSTASASPTQTSAPGGVFAEWASGPCTPPDAVTIEKHVNAMVDAVFKHYDNDRDGYISREEFDAVNTNFPFIASFCVLDADHDGMISKMEMQKYFIHANCTALKSLKSGFKHDFHETTYFKPTFCAHCAGLLWGLIRQGFKCRDCGISAHKHCKDLVVVECRTKQQQLADREHQAASSHAVTSRRRFGRKKKSSVSESESSPPSPKCSLASMGGSQSSQGSGPSSAPGSIIGERDSEDDIGHGLHGLHGPHGLHGQSQLVTASLPPSPQPMAMWGPRRKISDSLLVPTPGSLSHGNSPSRSLRSANSLETCCTRLMSHGFGHGHGLGHGHHRDVARDVAHLVHPPPLMHSATIHSPPSSLILHQSPGAHAATHGPGGAHGHTLPTLPLEPPGLSTIEALQHKLQAAEEQRNYLHRENQMLTQRVEELLRENQSLRDQLGNERGHTAAYIMRQMDTLHMQRDSHV